MGSLIEAVRESVRDAAMLVGKLRSSSSEEEDQHHFADEQTMLKIRKAHPEWSDRRVAQEMTKAEKDKGDFASIRKQAADRMSHVVASIDETVKKMFAAWDEGQHPRDEHGKFTDAGGNAAKFTQSSKAEKLAQLGYQLKTAGGDKDVWHHPATGVQVHVSKYNTTHPGNANLRKYEMFDSTGKKFSSGHQISNVEKLSQSINKTATANPPQKTEEKPAAAKPETGKETAGPKYTNFTEEEVFKGNGFKYAGTLVGNDIWKNDAGVTVKNNVSGYEVFNKAGQSVGKGVDVNTYDSYEFAPSLQMHISQATSSGAGKTSTEATPQVSGSGPKNAYLMEQGYKCIASTGSKGTDVYEKPGNSVKVALSYDSSKPGSPIYNIHSDNKQLATGNSMQSFKDSLESHAKLDPLTEKQEIAVSNAESHPGSYTPVGKGLDDSKAAKPAEPPAAPKEPSVPAGAKNTVLQQNGYKVVSNSTDAKGNKYDLWEHPDGSGAKISDLGNQKSAWEHVDKNGITTTGKYANDLQEAINKGGTGKPAAAPVKPAEPAAPAMDTGKEWQAKVHQTVNDLWGKCSTNNYDANDTNGLYWKAAQQMGIPWDSVKVVMGKIDSWQGGNTAQHGNPIGEWAQQVVNGDKQVHPGMMLEYAHTQKWMQEEGVPNGGTFYRGLSGSGGTEGLAAQVTMLNLLTKFSGDDFKVNVKTYGAEGFSTNTNWEKEKNFANNQGVMITKVNVDPKYIMTGKKSNPKAWDGYAEEQEWALAFPKSKMTLDSSKGDKMIVGADALPPLSLRKKMIFNALKELKKYGWDFTMQGNEITLIPPPQPKDDWLRIMRKTDRSAVNAVSPPGWKGTVEHMKDHPGIGNPYALAWYMKDKGDESHIEDEDAAADFTAPGIIERASVREKALKVTGKAYALAGYTSFQGLPISIENKKGSTRSGVNPVTKEKWSVVMPYDYGYIKGTRGADGQGVDVFLGPLKDAKFAYIVHQNTPDGAKYDEDKCFLGFKSADAAKAAYCSAYDNGGEFFNSMTVLPMHEFIKRVLRTKTMKRPGKIHAEVA